MTFEKKREKEARRVITQPSESPNGGKVKTSKGLLAGFGTESALRCARDSLVAEHVLNVEIYPPMAADEHPGGSPLLLLMIFEGVLGFVAFFLLMAYANFWMHPRDIGAPLEFTWSSIARIAIELGVMCSLGAGLFGFFLLRRMPAPYDPPLGRVSRSGWFLAVRAGDPQHLARARAILDRFRPSSMEELSS